jgi:hypothetical protein
MALFLEITVVVLVVGLLAATALAMAVGLVGGLAGEVVERCRQCDRYGLTVRGQPEAGPQSWKIDIRRVRLTEWSPRRS